MSSSGLHSLVPLLRCTKCMEGSLRPDEDSVRCAACGRRYAVRDGILDMIGEEPAGVITPFQRIMQTPLVVSVYERFWRRLGYFVASSRSFESEIETVLSLERGRGSPPLLDLACGTGVFTRPLARQCRGTVVGLDLSWPMLRYARRVALKEGFANIVLIRGTVLCLPFATSTFPYVNCCGALHLFDRPVAALEEIERILQPSGYLCVQTTIRPEHSAGAAWFLERLIRFGFFELDELHETIARRRMEILASERHRISYTFLARHVS